MSQRSRVATLSTDRIEKLASLPEWTWDTRDLRWDEGYRRLLNHVERTGTALAPKDYVDPDGYRLGQWVAVQRVTFRSNDLSADRAEKLGALPGWKWHVVQDGWDEAYRRLASYVERTGAALVPKDYLDNDGYRLGQWAIVQRSNFRRNELSSDRVEKLTSLAGWTWDTRDEMGRGLLATRFLCQTHWNSFRSGELCR